MLLVARFDYSRLRELKLGHLRRDDRLIVPRADLGAAAARVARWIELPFFTFQPSELGKVLLILALSAFIVDRARELVERETTSRIMLLALVPAMPRHRPAGPRDAGSSTWRSSRRCCSWPAPSGRTSPRSAALRAAAVARASWSPPRRSASRC